MSDSLVPVIDKANVDKMIGYVMAMFNEGYGGPQMLASKPIASRKDLAELYNATGSGSDSIADLDGQVVEIAHYIFQRGVFQSEDSDEPKPCGRVWLELANGISCFSASRSIVQEIARLVVVFGPAPWETPIRGMFHRGLTKSKKPWWHFEVDPTSFDAEA